MAELIIYRNGNPFTTVKIGEELVYNGQFMGENKIVGSFETPVTKEFFIGDYILHNSQKFILNELPELLREGKNQFTYGAVFESEEYSLYNKLLRHLKVSDFSYFGKPQQFVELILDNYNEISSGWTAGDIDDVDEGQNISFQEDSCRTALQKVVDAFDMEFRIDPILKQLHVKKSIGQLLPDVTFRYGMGNGLYSLTRQPAADTKVYTRFYGFGSSKNLPATYRSGTKRLIFEDEKIDRNIGIYGVRETAIVFEDIFPQRSSPITSINGENEITDSAIDFNLNSVVVDGQAKIVFKTGDLGGNEFLISSYNHATKTIKFKPNKDENGYVLPNDTVKASVGDIYTLVGIEMPQSYIDSAELRVKERTEEFADIYKDPQFAFALSIDEKFIRTNDLLGMINPGDRVAVEDSEMDVDTTLRVQAISYPISNPGKIQATINDKITYSLADKIKKYIAKQAQDIIIVNRNLAETGRDLSIRQQEFQNAVYDPDGYFDGTRIKPNTIEAISIKTGVRSQQFSLGVIFRFNYLAVPNSVQWTSGQLVHNTIDPTTIKTWNIAGNSTNGLNTTSLYYIFARCSKTTNDGIIVFDTVQHLVDADANYYYFLIGMVSSSISGVRWPSLTYGTTELNGRFITTGKIQSQDGSTSFDLDSGIIKGKITFGDIGVSTVVDGNLVTTSSIILGNGIVNNAGITGLGTLTTDIRFWAGADFMSRSSAPFRVDQSGRLFASNATISGHIEATSGTIAGVNINATDLFNLDGSKVKIFPDKGVRVLDGGYLSLPKTAPATADMPVGEWCMYVQEATAPGGSPPVVISRFTDLLDVDPAGRLQDYVVYWDASTAKHRYKAASFAPSDDVYSKSQINNFFGGVTTITGYNKGNWDMAFGWGNHAGLYQPLENQRLSTSDNVSFNSVFSDYLEGNTVLANDIYSYGEIRADGGLRSLNNGVYINSITGFSVNIVSPSLTGDRTVSLPNTSGQLALVSQIPTNVVFNDGGTYNLNISGSALLWNGTPFTAGNIPDTPYFITLNGSATNAGYSSLGQVSASLGVNNGSTLNNNISGSAMYWGGNQANFSTEVGSFSHLMGFEGGVGKYGGPAKVKAFLGLPTSGAYDLQWITINGNTTTTSARFGGKLTWGNGFGETNLGEIYNDAALGTVLIPKFGSSFDFSLTSGNGSTVFQIPTGTLNAIFNGNVGIGTSPTSKLTVNGNISAGAGNQKIYYDILENYGSSLKVNAAGGLPLLLQNDGSTVISITGGNVGIGITSPSYKLEVDGNGGFTGQVIAGGRILAQKSGGDGSDWTNAHLEIQGIKPGIAFHYPGIYAASLFLDGVGGLNWLGARINANAFNAYGEVSASRIVAGYDSGVAGSVNASAWFRSIGNSGWYNTSYGGGIYMYDSTWVRTFNQKGFYVDGSTGIMADAAIVSNTKLKAPTVWATDMLVVPKVDPVVADMPVGEWVLRIKEVV